MEPSQITGNRQPIYSRIHDASEEKSLKSCLSGRVASSIATGTDESNKKQILRNRFQQKRDNGKQEMERLKKEYIRKYKTPYRHTQADLTRDDFSKVMTAHTDWENIVIASK